MSGRVDIYHTRRGMFHKCMFWNRDEDNYVGSANEWILKHKPEGIFYAKEVSPNSQQENNVNGMIMFDRNMITLQSHDDLDSINRGSIVLYNGHAWMVESVQKTVHQKESEFCQHLDYIWVISLRS